MLLLTNPIRPRSMNSIRNIHEDESVLALITLPTSDALSFPFLEGD